MVRPLGQMLLVLTLLVTLARCETVAEEVNKGIAFYCFFKIIKSLNRKKPFKMARRINEYRVANGRSSVTLSQQLFTVASVHARVNLCNSVILNFGAILIGNQKKKNEF
jgi:hypothetical protein